MRPPPSSAVRRAVAAGLPLLVGSVSAGCSGGDERSEPVIDQQAVASEATPSPTPSATPAPEPWEKRTKAGAVAFVEHWVEVFNEAGATGDSSGLRTVSTPECTTCLQLATLIDDFAAEGVTIRTDGWRTRVVQPASFQDSAPYDMLVSIRRSPQVVRSSDGSIERFPGGPQTYSARVIWRNGQWLMDRFNQAA